MKRIMRVIIGCIIVATMTARHCIAQTANRSIGEQQKKISLPSDGKYDEAEYKRGLILYKNKCQFCHGVLGDGKGPAAEPLLRHPVDFTDPEFWKEDVNKKIAVTIKNGKEMMPAFNLEPDQIKFITLYISQTFKN